ncbi:hypothetical protein IMSAG049_00581 [Clostridiales bacterium]|nr:hypothetical protein IMSAG049_00581 [Clostridiales bacterium]
MNSTIDILYKIENTANSGAHTAKKSVNQASFLDMLSEAEKTKNAVLTEANETRAESTMWSADYLKVQEAARSEKVSLEDMLKTKYPNIKYHVFDASSGYWRTRNDYPHYMLYQDNIDTEALENWEPSGENPFYGSIDGKFIAPKEISALGNIAPGSKAVVIHPKVQERMDKDPEYAKEIMMRIDTWFVFDAARNEAIIPGSAIGMSQCVAIGENGEIVNAQSSSQPKITYSQSSSDDSWWELRVKRQAKYFELIEEAQKKHRIQLAMQEAAARASGGGKKYLIQFIEGNDLITILGNTVAGTPTSSLLEELIGLI